MFADSQRNLWLNFIGILATVALAQAQLLFTSGGVVVLMVNLAWFGYQAVRVGRGRQFGRGLLACGAGLLVALNIFCRANAVSTGGEQSALSALAERSTSLRLRNRAFILVYSRPLLGANTDYFFDLYQSDGWFWYRVNQAPILVEHNLGIGRGSANSRAIAVFKAKCLAPSGAYRFTTVHQWQQWQLTKVKSGQ